MPKVKFIEENHTYLDEQGEDLISVSKFTERFKPKVDWNELARKYALKLTKAGTPTTTDDVIKRWDSKRQRSALVGTLFHELREQELLASDKPKFYGSMCAIEGASYEGTDKISTCIHEIKNNTVYPELMIYDFEHRICGQSDKVIVVNNKINIWDYKTDQKIDFKGWGNEWASARKMLPPLAHLDECNGNMYAIKMSIYMYLLWKANKGKFKPGEIIIEHCHLKRDVDNDNIPVLEDLAPVILKTDIIKLPYLKKEVIAMLKTLSK